MSASATALVEITAILNNNKRLDDMGARITRLERSMDRLESRLDHIEQMLGGDFLDVARI